MTSRHITVWAAIALASVATSFADPPATVYVTTGPGRHVLAISIDPTTGTQVGPAQVLVASDAALTDLTQRSDGIVHYATPAEIRRVGSAGVLAAAGAQELRFSAYNCLFYNSPSGVGNAGCATPSSGVGSGGRGLAFDLFGNLLAISGTSVIRIPVNASGATGAPTTLVAAGLATPTGIAVAAGKGANGLERGDFVVTDGRYARLYDGKTGALKNATYASVPADQTLAFADFDADDRLWLASMTANEALRTPNGRLYRADGGNAVCSDIGGTSCALAALLPQLTGKYWPAVGLALAPSSRLLTQAIAPTVPNAAQRFEFDFGGSIVEVSGTVIDACNLQVRSSAVFTQNANALVNNAQYSLNPYLGEEGFPTVHTIKSLKNGVEVDANACVEVSTANKPTVFIAALTSSEINPRLLRCESGCGEIELLGWYHTGPIDGDGEGGGRVDDWSDWLIVEKAIAPSSGQVQFCGIGTPLRTDRVTVVNPGSNLTVKAQFSLPGLPCGSGGFLTDPNARFLISLARIAPTHEKKPLIGASGNSSQPATLDQGGKSYEFELSLNEPNGDDYADGLYEITIADVTPGGSRLVAPVTIYFRVGKR